MSAQSLALLRSNQNKELKQLAAQHLQNDLQESDRQLLNNSATKLSTYTSIGSAIGLGLGVLLAFRARRFRTRTFEAFRAKEKPVKVLFEDGRAEAIPDLTPLLKPSTLGDVATYFFFSIGGLFFGGELGLLAGTVGVKSSITKDPESQKRIEIAFRKFKADVLRKEVAALDAGSEKEGGLGLF